MKNKEKKEDLEFFKYQKLCYERLENLLDAGWNDFKFNQPPEFILGIVFINSMLTHPNLCLEGKQGWLTTYKKVLLEMPDDVEDNDLRMADIEQTIPQDQGGFMPRREIE